MNCCMSEKKLMMLVGMLTGGGVVTVKSLMT